MKDKLELMWRTYDTINDLIKFSDTKAAALLALNGIVLSFIFSLFNKDILLPENQIILIFIVLGLIAGIISIIICIFSIIPVLDMRNPQSLLFFGNIAERFKYPHDYERTVRNELDEYAQLTQITNQVWKISNIAYRKYRIVIWATYFFAFMIGLIGLSGIFMIYSK